jgi:hypothetical protein
MSADVPQEPRSSALRRHAVGDFALVAGVSIDRLVRERATTGLPKPVLFGAGLLIAGAVVALAKLVGADLPGGFGAGQPGLLPALLSALSVEEPDVESG